LLSVRLDLCGILLYHHPPGELEPAMDNHLS
jgi:hypothetical protein